MLVWITLPPESRNPKTGKYEYSLNDIQKESDFRGFTENVEEPFFVKSTGKVRITTLKKINVVNII